MGCIILFFTSLGTKQFFPEWCELAKGGAAGRKDTLDVVHGAMKLAG